MGTGIKKPVKPIHIGKTNYKDVLDRLHQIVNGGINYGSIQGGVAIKGNVDSIHVNATFPNPGDVDVTITHNLNRIPTGYKLVSANNPVSIYDGSIARTNSQITLRGHLGGANPAIVVLEIY